MAKLAIFSSFDEIARPLEGARTQNHYRSISYDIWGHISISLFEIQKFLFFTPPYCINENLVRTAYLYHFCVSSDEDSEAMIYSKS